MSSTFGQVLSALRRERGMSQRTAAAELHISQALLSHYEKSIREPGLDFVVRACDYYGVSADYMLGRTAEPGARPRRAGSCASSPVSSGTSRERAEILRRTAKNETGPHPEFFHRCPY